MSDPFELVESHLSHRGKVRLHGRDHLRAACPACGGKSTNTLSVRRGDNGTVLLKCFKSGCEVETIAHALGLDLSDLFPERDDARPVNKPRRIGLMLPMQAIELIANEAWLTAVAAENLANGYTLTDVDLARLRDASARIQGVYKELHQ